MYYEYWGLNKPPFDNVPDPSMYADCHVSMESAIAETLFGIEEGDECIAVIVGDVGLGKTMTLRMIIDSLDPDKYRMALIANPGMSFVQILREIIGQLTGTQCTEKRKVDLLEIFNKLLFETLEEDKRVLIFIDEANAIAPANLESLRLLTNMQQDQHNLFTMVLAGQIELARRLEHPKRANLFQRIGTYSRIDKIGSPELVETYVTTRLKHAGGTKEIFSDDAVAALYEHSDHGVPRLINKIAKLSLKAGETNGLNDISGEVVNKIGERFKRLTGSAIGKRRPRKKPDEIGKEEYDQDRIVSDEFPERFEAGLTGSSEDTSVSVAPEVASEVAVPELTTIEEPVPETAMPEEAIEEEETEVAPEVASVVTVPELEVIEEPVSQAPVLEPEEAAEEEEEVVKRGEIVERLEIGGYVIDIEIPSTVIEQVKYSTQEQRVKVAGSLAAQILEKNPQVMDSPVDDPVHIWGEIRTVVLNQFG